MFALIKENTVQEVSESKHEVHPSLVWKECPNDIEIGFLFEDGKFVDPFVKTVEERETKIKNKRNRLLRESDWAVLPDAPVSNEQEWRDYRQALRDVPQQSGFPDDITWPTEP